MISDLPVHVEMPLGVDPANDFSAYVGAFSVETPYGLSPATTGLEPTLSPSLVLKLKAADPAPRLHAIVRGRLLYRPQSGIQPARLELQPLPFAALSLSKRLPGSKAPKLIAYENIDSASLSAAASVLLKNVEKSKQAAHLSEFLSGTRWILVAGGDYIGRAATTGAPVGFRMVAISMKSQGGLLVNPAHYLYQLPIVNDKLVAHPLLAALQTRQHDSKFTFKAGAKVRYVASSSSGSDGKFLTAATASKDIVSAVAASAAGDIVVVLDNATYAEQLDFATGIQLISSASLGLPAPPGKTAPLPKLKPPTAKTRMVLNILGNSTGVSGFSIEGGKTTPGDGGGVLIQDATDVEIANNRIVSNECFRGGGIGVRSSSSVSISRNRIEKNVASGTEAFDSVLANRGQGGGVYVGDSRSVRIATNIIVDNEAGNFGGGIAVVSTKAVSIRGNAIGDKTAHIGNRVTGDSAVYSVYILQRNPRGGGGGIGVSYSDVIIAANDIHYNASSRGGGIEFFGSAHGQVADNTIEFNTTRPPTDGIGPDLGGDGGGIAVNPISTDLEEVLATRAITISRNRIGWNSAGDDGGGGYGTTRALLQLLDNDIYHNTARLNGGGVRITFGAGLALSGGSITDNTCNAGGADGGGGGISMLNAAVVVKNCAIEGNQALSFGGGGVYGVSAEYEDWTEYFLTIFDISFEDLLEKFGFQRSSLELVDCKIPSTATSQKQNSATAGGGLYVAHAFYGFSVTIKNTFLKGNVSTHQTPAKSQDVVIENTDGKVSPTITSSGSDPLLQQLQPLVSYEKVFGP